MFLSSSLPSSTSSFKSFSRFVGLCHTLSFRTEQCTFIYATVHAFITHRDKIYRASYRILIELFYCFFFLFCHIQYPLRMIISLLQLFCFCTFLWLDWNSEEDILIHIQSARLKQKAQKTGHEHHIIMKKNCSIRFNRLEIDCHEIEISFWFA